MGKRQNLKNMVSKKVRKLEVEDLICQTLIFLVALVQV